MIHIDHVSLGVQNLYEGALRLLAETGFAAYDGGHFPGTGVANRIVPLGGDFYIEIESVIDTFAWERGVPTTVWFREQLVEGDVFIGWCARVDHRDELQAIANRLGSPVYEGALRTRVDGTVGHSVRTPDTIRCWDAGLPNFFFYGDYMHEHAARIPAPHRVAPDGLAWLEVGGTREAMLEWLGPAALPSMLRFNGLSPGLYAVAIDTSQGEVVIRRPAGKRLLNTSPTAAALPSTRPPIVTAGPL